MYIAPNGVRQRYDKNPRIPLWVMGMSSGWKERTSRYGVFEGTGANTIMEQMAGHTRFTVKCKQNAGDGIKDLKLALQRDYLDSPDDFMNVEITGYVEILTTETGSKPVVFYGPTGRHPAIQPDQAIPEGCSGACYKVNLRFMNGRIGFAKENYHNVYSTLPDVVPSPADQAIVKACYKMGKRVGFKWANFRYRDAQGKWVRRLEIWLDVGGAITYSEAPKNQWKLIAIKEDDGSFPWGQNMSGCGCPSNTQIISWGAPWVTYRTDNNDLKLSLCTVQEIIPPISDIGTVV